MKKLTLILCSLLINPLLAFAIETGSSAPNFELQSFSGNKFKLEDYRDKIVVLEWTNPGCPFVKKHYENGNMQKLHNDYRKKGVIWVSINSTNVSHQDHLDKVKADKVSNDWKIDANFMLDDSDGKIGQLYGAKSTPHMFIINKGKLAYQGAIDDNNDIYETSAPKKNYVSNAIEEILNSKSVTEPETKAYGCGVKYQ